MPSKQKLDLRALTVLGSLLRVMSVSLSHILHAGSSVRPRFRKRYAFSTHSSFVLFPGLKITSQASLKAKLWLQTGFP